MQFLTVVRTVLALLPAIIEAVKAIEAALPVSGQGAAKLALIRSTLQSAFIVAKDASVTFEQVWPAIESAISAVVGLFNKAGVFGKG